VLISLPEPGKTVSFEGCALSLDRKEIEAKSQKIDIGVHSIDASTFSPTEMEQIDDGYILYAFHFEAMPSFARVRPSSIELHCARYIVDQNDYPAFPYPSLASPPSNRASESISWR